MNRHKRKRLSTVGRRTGVDLKRKHIRILPNGVEDFGDYFSSAESSSDSSSPESSPTSSSKNNPMTSSPLRSGAPRMSSFIKDKEQTKTTPTRACKNLSFSKSPDADEVVTPVKKSKNKETHTRYSFGNKTNASIVENNLSSPIQKSEKQKRFAKGRRTGVLLDEKRIGIKDGFEIFNDYFTDTNSENSSQSGYSKISKEPPSSLCSEAPQPGIDTMRQSIPQSSHLESSQSTTYIDKNKSNVSSSKGSPTRSSAVKQLLISLHTDQTENTSSLKLSEKRGSINTRQKSPLKSPRTLNKTVSFSSENAAENMETNLSVGQRHSKASVKEFLTSSNSEINESCSESEVSETDKQSEVNLNLTVNKGQTNAGSKSKITEDIHDKSSLQQDNMSKSLHKDQIEIESSIKSAKKRGSRSFVPKSKENILESPLKSPRTFNKRVSLLNENASENMKTRLSAVQKQSKASFKEILASSNSEVNEFCSESDVSETDKQSEVNLNLTVNKGKTNTGSKSKITEDIHDHSSNLNSLQCNNKSKSQSKDQIKVKSSLKSAEKRKSISFTSKSKKARQESPLKSPKSFNKKVSLLSEDAFENMETRLSSEVNESCCESEVSETDKQSEVNLNVTVKKGQTNAGSKSKITEDVHDKSSNLNDIQPDNMSKSLHKDQIGVESSIKSAKKRGPRSFTSQSKENILDSPSKSHRTFNKRVSLLNENTSKNMDTRLSAGQKHSKAPVKELLTSSNSEVNEFCSESDVSETDKQSDVNLNLTVNIGKTNAGSKFKTTVDINEQSSSLNGLQQDNISKSMHTDQIEVENSIKSAKKRGSKSLTSKSKESKLESSLKSPKKFNKRVSMQSEDAIKNMEMRLSSGQKHSKASVNDFVSSSNSEIHGSCSDSEVSETDKQSEYNLNLIVNKGKTNAVSKSKITEDIHNEQYNLNDLQQDNMSKSLHQGQNEVDSVINSAKKRGSRSFTSKSKENIPENSLKSPRTFNKSVSLLNENVPKYMKSFSSAQKQSRTSVQEIHSSGNSDAHESTDDSSVLQKDKEIQKSPEAQTNLIVTKRKTKAQKKSKKADGQKEENQVRRSERVKVPPLERWRGQCRFTKLVNGEWITVFEEGRPEDNSAVEKILKKQKNYQSQKKKEKSNTKFIKKRKLKDNTLNLEEVKGEISKIPVVNPSTSEEVCVYLYRPYKTLLWSTPAAYDSHNSPYSITKCITGKDNIISFGYIDIEVSQTKAAQYSPTDNITFNIIQGKVKLKLYKSLINLKERDVVTVPCFNNYSITNTGKVNAILYYCSFRTPLFSYQCFESSGEEEE